MLRLGVPCIEYINLQNIPGVDIINGKPLTPLARYNFVTSASDYNEFKLNNKGKTILVVGHSNTIPSFTNGISKKKLYNKIEKKFIIKKNTINLPRTA